MVQPQLMLQLMTYTDATGNNNSEASQFNWTYDGTAPTLATVTTVINIQVIGLLRQVLYSAVMKQGTMKASNG